MQEIDRDDDLGWLVDTLDNILGVQRPLVVNHLRSLRRRRPDLTPEQVIRRLERQYLAAVTGGGAAVGATAVAPGVGTIAALGLTVAETVVFLEASAFFAQAVTEVHGIPVEDPERAKALVMGLMLGSGGEALVKRVAEQSLGRGASGSAYWGELITSSLPAGMMGQLVDFLRRGFMKRITRNTGASMLGRALPFGIGAVVGGAGNNILGRQVVGATRDAFGPAPVAFDANLATVLGAPRPRLSERIRTARAIEGAPRRSLSERMREARAIEREGLGGGLQRFRERLGSSQEGHDDDAPPKPEGSDGAPTDPGR
jgi:hypothetical protein